MKSYFIINETYDPRIVHGAEDNMDYRKSRLQVLNCEPLDLVEVVNWTKVK